MSIFKILASPILLILSVTALVIGAVSFAKAVVATFRMIGQIKPEAYEKYPSLEWNPFNSIYCRGALTIEGKKQRKLVLKNFFIFGFLLTSTVLIGDFVGGS